MERQGASAGLAVLASDDGMVSVAIGTGADEGVEVSMAWMDAISLGMTLTLAASEVARVIGVSDETWARVLQEAYEELSGED